MPCPLDGQLDVDELEVLVDPDEVDGQLPTPVVLLPDDGELLLADVVPADGPAMDVGDEPLKSGDSVTVSK